MKPKLGSLRPERRHLNLRYSVRDTDMIESWAKEGYTVEQVAARLNVSAEEIRAILRELRAK